MSRLMTGRPAPEPPTREDLLKVIRLKESLAKEDHKGVQCSRVLLTAIRKELEKK